MCKYIQKTWTLYLQGENNFVDTFQAWLNYVKAKSECSIKTLRVDGGGEFILAKLRLFYKKKL